MTKRRPLVYRDSTHQPLDAADQLDYESLPVSAAHGNLVRNVDGELYVGYGTGRIAYYVADSGVDDPLGGTKAAPFKTLDYAFARLSAIWNGEFRGNSIIALKAGETFTMNELFYCYGHIALTFYDDPQYGDFNSPAVNNAASPSVMSDLNRPVINVGIQPSTVGGTAGIILFPGNYNQQLKCTLMGVKVNLPGGPHSTGAVDFVTGIEWGQSALRLYGAIINMTDPSAEFGLYGLEASCKGSLYQFCSKLTINDVEVGAGATVPQLQARKNFLKFYPDFAGNIQTGLQLHAGSPGTALMDISWSDCSSLPVAPGKVNQASYPFLSDPTFGLGPYFFNLTRDAQGRPLNAWSGRLF